MFTIYIDDSGSSPEHKVVVASGIIFPARQLLSLEKEWNNFLDKEGIQEFHSSVCLARNHHSPFADWDDDRVSRVFSRVRQITLKYSVKAFCIAIFKPDYMEVMPEDMRKRVGSYYTWALSSVLGLAHDWAVERAVPMEYVFDNADKQIKREIEESIRYSESIYADHFSGHYSFRDSKEVPALQASDLFAWTCFQQGRHVRTSHPIHPLAQEGWKAYADAHSGEWCLVQSLTREGLENWVKNAYLSPQDLSIKAFKEELRELRKLKRKKTVNS